VLSVASRLPFSYCRNTVTRDNGVSEGKEENGLKKIERREKEENK
jgi:hypothetical protein